MKILQDSAKHACCFGYAAKAKDNRSNVGCEATYSQSNLPTFLQLQFACFPFQKNSVVFKSEPFMHFFLDS